VDIPMAEISENQICVKTTGWSPWIFERPFQVVTNPTFVPPYRPCPVPEQ
jgi:hypothetical protein